MNKIIVEGKNDKGFIDWCLKRLSLNNVTIIETYTQQLEHGLSEETLKRALIEIKNKDLEKINHLGIIIDIDNFTTADRIGFLNKIMNEIFQFQNCFIQESTINKINVEGNDLLVSCFFMKASSGQGELNNLLKEIKARGSKIADCMESCCKGNLGNMFNEKEFDDSWTHLYMKWDCNNLKGRTNSKNFDLSKSSIEQMNSFWNFEAIHLQPLKSYLQIFKQD